jgi:hypothetical protein
VPVSQIHLSPEQLRVLGCLLEKQRTTPDAYPLSLNALRLACNQSTNRDPIVEYDEATLRDALHRLERRGLVRLASGAGSRASKYRHLLAEQLPMDDAEQALMCVLMLRGAQTPGELKQRGERIHAFAGLQEVGETLERLQQRALVVRLPRRPGQKEERYEHLLGMQDDEQAAPAAPGAESAASAPVGSWRAAPVAAARDHDGASVADLQERIGRLESEVAELRRRLDAREGAGNGGAPAAAFAMGAPEPAP